MQIKNYNKHSNNNCQHIFHISKEGRDNFSPSDLRLLIEQGNVFFSNYSNQTSWLTCIGAFIACSELIDGQVFDYVYIHTDGDLIISGDLDKHIYGHKLGYSSIPIANANEWIHYAKLVQDRRFEELRSSLNISFDDVVYGRQEGSFYSTELWLKIISKISEYYDSTFFDDLAQHWPIEEAVIPTLAKFYSENSKHVRNVVRTKEWITTGGRDNPVNCIDLSDLSNYISSSKGQCIAIKWFSQDINDQARLFVTKG